MVGFEIRNQGYAWFHYRLKAPFPVLEEDSRL